MKALVALNAHPKVKRQLRALVDRIPMRRGERLTTLRLGPLKGYVFPLDLNTSDRHLWFDTYEPWVQRTLSEVLSPGMVVWDVGAYIGYYVALACKLTGGKVLAVEPDLDNVRRMRSMIEANHVSGVVVVCVAIGDKERESSFESNRMIGAITTRGAVKVPVTTLDILAEQHGPPDFIIMDIEGGEVDALVGAPNLLGKFRPQMLVELHGAAGVAAASHLQTIGYNLTTQAGGPIDVQMRTSHRVHALATARQTFPK
jgi:FkbM family methyltransferase